MAEIDFDAEKLTGAMSSMAAAYDPLKTKLQNQATNVEPLAGAWKTPEGAACIAQFENISTGVENFEKSYSSLTSFLSKSVSINYSSIEQELAAALAAANGGAN